MTMTSDVAITLPVADAMAVIDEYILRCKETGSDLGLVQACDPHRCVDNSGAKWVTLLWSSVQWDQQPEVGWLAKRVSGCGRYHFMRVGVEYDHDLGPDKDERVSDPPPPDEVLGHVRMVLEPTIEVDTPQMTVYGLLYCEDDGPWFDKLGSLIRRIPQECINECARSGDNSEACARWAKKLDIMKGLDVRRVKGHLKEYGGWSADELRSMSYDRTAQTFMWCLCWDIADSNMDQSAINVWAEPLPEDKKEGAK